MESITQVDSSTGMGVSSPDDSFPQNIYPCSPTNTRQESQNSGGPGPVTDTNTIASCTPIQTLHNDMDKAPPSEARGASRKKRKRDSHGAIGEENDGFGVFKRQRHDIKRRTIQGKYLKSYRTMLKRKRQKKRKMDPVMKSDSLSTTRIDPTESITHFSTILER